MKGTIWVLLAAGALFPQTAAAQCGTCDPCTAVGGLIMTDTTWNATGSPYCVTQSVIVGGSATLTIEPGVEVRFAHGLGLSVGYGFGPGTLVARGTAESPICFTTNDPCEGGLAEPGDWARVLFENDAVDATFDGNGNYVSGCIMEHVNLEYSGSAGAAITATNASPYVAHCNVHDHAGNAIQFDATNAGPVRIEYCHVHDQANGKGIHVKSSASWPVRIENCEVDHCGGAYTYGAGIYLDAGTGHQVRNNFVHDCELTGSGDKVGGGMYINAPSTLDSNTISANSADNGSGYNTAYGGGIMLDTGSDGSMVSNNVVTGNWADSYYAANGGGICLWNAPGCTLTGNTVSGNWVDGWGAGIRLQGSENCVLSENTVSNNENGGYWSPGWKGGGIAVRDSTNCLFQDNTITGNWTEADNADGAGLYLYNSSTGTGEGKGIRGNTISGNTTAGASADGAGIYLENSSSSIIALNTVSGNQTAGDNVDGTGITLLGSSNCILQSNVIKANQGLGTENDGSGVALVNSGTCPMSSNIIRDNSCTDEGGGVFLYSAAGTTMTCNAIIGNSAGCEGAAICLWNSNNCTLTKCRILDNRSTNCLTGGISVNNSFNLDLSGDLAAPCDYNTICGNSGYDIYNNNSTGNNIHAENVRWCMDDPSVCIYDYFDDGTKGIVFWYPPVDGCVGDLNCDGQVDFGDINPFVLYLSNFDAWPAAFPCSDPMNGDIDEDGTWGQGSFGDINPFVVLMTQCGNGCTCP
jgi:parallel beta-helix repeat protein